MGKLQGAFHEVIDIPNSIVLVYDSRYEDGVQCLPPLTIASEK